MKIYSKRWTYQSCIARSTPRKNRVAKHSRTFLLPVPLSLGTGRLDNRAELISELAICLNQWIPRTRPSSQWPTKSGVTNCFAKLIGDWALSIWNSNAALADPGQRPNRHSPSLLLLRQRSDYLEHAFSIHSSFLQTKPSNLNEEYIAGWLSMFPAVHLTPCVGVHAVPPSSFVFLSPGKQTVSKYWDFDSG